MIDQFLLTSYGQQQVKTAQRELIDKLKTFPLDELLKCASGDPTSKLAFDNCVGPPGECASWVDQFKGTPLFEQAVELERQSLQAEAQEQERRKEMRTVDQQSWDARDALNLKRRMLALELATARGGGGPEATEEKGVQMLEEAQAEERAAGEGGEPHEQAEDQAIQQFRAAQSQEAAEEKQEQAQPQQPPKKPPQAAAAEEEGPPMGEKPKEEKPKGMSVEVKQAGAWGSDSRRVAPGSNHQVQSSDSGQGAGSLTAYTPGENESFHTVVSTKEARAVLASVGFSKEALSHSRIIDAVRKAPEGRMGRAFEHGVDLLGKAKSGKLTDQADTLATAASARLAGGNWKRELTNLKAIRKTSAGAADEMKAEVSKKYPGLVKKEASPAIPAAAAGAVAGAHKAQAHGQDARAGVLRGAAGAVGGSSVGHLIGGALGAKYNKGPLGSAIGGALGGVAGYKALTRGLEKKKEAGVLGAVSAAAPKLVSGIGGALSAGKNLAQTAHAAGGLPQVAKSFGNVAAQFAQKNPLAAAGVAGGAGLLAGRVLSSGGQR